MSRMVRPSPDIARGAGAVLFFLIAGIHFLNLPAGFRLGGYVGVSLVLSCVINFAGVVGIMVEPRARIWWYALVTGGLTLIAWIVTQSVGLPLTTEEVSGQWVREPVVLAQPFVAASLAALAGWVLLSRAYEDTNATLSRERERLLHRR
ncbi:hypothetical protein LO762_32120 [Actinocorallia sp. API 0066]|uniref:hypothetical protein n=1 Tax=Actinocorallia sp. API 0066 TaxID=2896846 RepID=UPI001E3CB10D|nr:hypothetical protein [Actinocorallia sp. API 0066]MCD0453796.1 hypothetical protein [Actinocorallia sp. API 0066]